MRVAAIDCGTNSIRLLIADLIDGVMHERHREMRVVRLGEGVDATGAFGEAALQRTFAACDDYAQLCRAHGAERIRFVATSASRDASNRDVFIAGVRERLGVTPDVISGDEEARLSFSGATRELVGREPAPYLVVDIGGGSTEFVLGEQAPVAARSVDMGCVRMTERHLAGPAPDQAALVANIDTLIDVAAQTVDFAQARTLIAVAGSATTVAAMALRLPAYDRDAIHLARLSAQTVGEVADRLWAMTHDERAALPFMHPGRVDVIVAGAAILKRIVQRLGVVEIIISEHDILDGIAWSMA